MEELADILSDLCDIDIGLVAGADYNVHHTAVLEVDSDLSLGISHEDGVGIGIHILLNGRHDSVGDIYRQRKVALSFIGGISEDDALVAGADHIFGAVYSFADFRRLLGDEIDDVIHLISEFVCYTPYNRFIVDLGVGLDLACEDDGRSLDKCFYAAS